MKESVNTLKDLERRFWQSMVDEKTETALKLLDEPALMVSAHGSMKFDHAAYRKMAEQGQKVLKRFELGDMEAVFPNDDTAILMYNVKQTTAPRDGKEASPWPSSSASCCSWCSGRAICCCFWPCPG